jgi:3-keto-5-aminohexanoate cleavage enzyme
MDQLGHQLPPLIISCALTGSTATVADNPNLPFDPEAIGRSAVEAWREGASIVHIHARDEAGNPAWSGEFFKRSIDVIRAADCDVLINLTTSYGSVDADDWEKRFEPLSLRPEIASFDCGSMNFGPWVFRNAPQFLDELAARMHEHGVKPELEIFDSGQIGNALRIGERLPIGDPPFFQLVLGIDGGAPASAENLFHLVGQLPAGAPWSVCAIGRSQLPANMLAIAAGGHARTGLEDNLWLRRGVPATNGALVERVRAMGELAGRPIATPAQTRELLGIERVSG